MNYSAKDITLESFLRESSGTLGMQDYQRDYQWSREDVLYFLERFAGSQLLHGHFLDTISVLKDGKKTYIVDGQHRIATSIFLLISIFPRLEGKEQRRVGDILETMDGNKKLSLLNTAQEQEFNYFYLTRVGSNTQLKPPAKKTKVSTAFATIDSWLDKQKDNVAVLALNHILPATLVEVTLPNRESAEYIFITKNSGGKQTEAFDVLRGELLSQALDDRERSEIHKAFSSVSEVDISDRTTFLRYTDLARIGDYFYNRSHNRLTGREVNQYLKSAPVKNLPKILESSALALKAINAGKNPFSGKPDRYRQQYPAKKLEQYFLPLLAAKNADDFSRISRYVFYMTSYLRLTSGKWSSGVASREIYTDMAHAILHDRPTTKIEVADREGLRHHILSLSPGLPIAVKRALLILEDRMAMERKLPSHTFSELHIEHVQPKKTRPDLSGSLGNLVVLGANGNMSLQDSPYEKKRNYYLNSHMVLAAEYAKRFDDPNEKEWEDYLLDEMVRMYSEELA